MRTEAPLLAPIFRSDGQAQILASLILTGDELSITELADRTNLAYPTVHREISRLLAAGILTERSVGRTRLVRTNDESPLASPLREILLVTAGPARLIERELSLIDGVHSAFLYGSFAARLRGIPGPAPQDIDLMIIGDPDPEAVYAAADRVESAVGRPVNATILTPAEARAESGFLRHVATNPTVPIMGEPPW